MTRWPGEFARLRDAQAQVLGAWALRIDHIGSTSVPGLGAKDVIDVQVTVREIAPEIKAVLLRAGYGNIKEYSRDHVPLGEDPTQALWIKMFFTECEGQRRANIHMRKLGHPNQRYPLLFRDYLRCARTPIR